MVSVGDGSAEIGAVSELVDSVGGDGSAEIWGDWEREGKVVIVLIALV